MEIKMNIDRGDLQLYAQQLAKRFGSTGYPEDELLTALIALRGWRVDCVAHGELDSQDIELEVEFDEDTCTVVEFKGAEYLSILLREELPDFIGVRIWEKYHEAKLAAMDQKKIDAWESDNFR